MRKLELLHNLDEWNKWKGKNFSDPFDSCSEPAYYPCYGYAVVKHWEYQIEEAHYLYEEDLDTMLRAMFNP